MKDTSVSQAKIFQIKLSNEDSGIKVFMGSGVPAQKLFECISSRYNLDCESIILTHEEKIIKYTHKNTKNLTCSDIPFGELFVYLRKE